MGSPQKQFTFAIDLPVRSEWTNVDVVRNAILNCFRTVFRDVDGCQRIAMVAGELMENAIKYGHWVMTEDRPLRLRLGGTGERVEVSVESPVDPGSPRVKDLFATLDWLGGFPSAADAFRARMLDIASAPAGSAGSKLGLARIAYEGNCQLAAEIEGDVLRVKSQMQIPL
jgi:hypothetical protein